MKLLNLAVKISILAITLLVPCGPLLQAKDTEEAGNEKLGSIDGKIITVKQIRSVSAKNLESLELKLLQSKAAFIRDEHKILEETLEDIIKETLVKDEAASRGISNDELWEIEVAQKVQEPTVEEIDAFYQENGQRISMTKEEATPHISDYLKKMQENTAKAEFLKKLEKNHKIVRLLKPLRFEVDTSGRPSKGPLSAPVVLVYFSDFQCSYCSAFSKTLNQVVENYGDKIRLVFRQFPLTEIHPDAQRAAEASLCAEAQSHFWEMYDLMFDNFESLKDEDLLKMAEQTGLDTDTFQSCLASGQYRSLVQEDIRAGTTAGTEGTPTLFINGRYLHGSYPYEEVAEIIDEELKLKNSPE